MSSSYSSLIGKLEEFIRKYYKNRMLQGLLYTITALLSFYLLATVLEYLAWFSSGVRTVLFWSYIIINTFILFRFVGIPLLSLMRMGKRLSYTQAAAIIGTHFGEVRDTLTNVLQLQRISAETDGASALLEAAIDQKIRKISPVPFTRAIDFRSNRKYLKYALPPVFVLIILLLTAPNVITGPSKRLVDFSSVYERPAPFTFEILNASLDAVQQEDYQLDVKLNGEEVPAEVTIVINDYKYKLERENTALFHYLFKNPQQNIDFFFEAEGFKSQLYTLRVVARPQVLNFEMLLHYPAYLQKKDEVLQNSGDIIVPEGTQVNWRLKTRDTRWVQFRFPGKTAELTPLAGGLFSYTMVCRQSMNYSVKTKNDHFANRDSMQYMISVMADQYPGITVEQFKDSVYDKRLYFSGDIHDDYGVSALQFKYILRKSGEENDAGDTAGIRSVPFQPGLTQQTFYYFLDLGELGLSAGDEVEYFFEVWDNDGVNGHKSTRSQHRVFKAPTADELEAQTERSNEQIRQDMEEAIRQAQQLQREIDKVDRKLTEKKTLSYQEKKQIQGLMDKQQELQQQIDQLKLENQQNNIREQEYKQVDPEILEKQKQLEKLFDEIMTDEMKELFRKLQEMMDKLNKDDVKKALDQMKLTNEDIKKELDRNLELFKQLEVDKKLQDNIDKLDQLHEEQKKLADESRNSKTESKNIKEKQDALNKQFDELRKEMDTLQQKNSALENPQKMPDTDEQEQQIQQQMQQSSEQLQDGKKSNASKSQESAAEQMKQLSENLKKMQQDMEMEQQAEDIQALRQILENLVRVSFSQEDLMNELKNTSVSDPRYVRMMAQQKDIKDHVSMIGDSLYALSRRQPMIESYVNREMSDIRTNLDRTLESLHNRTSPATATYQQYVMTSVNDLALMLAEILQQMQEQMQQSQQNKSNCKSGQCQKPGSSKPSASSMRKLQDQLNKQMQQLKEQMEGKNPGKTGQGQQSMSEQLARLAAQQEALRQMLQEYGEEDKRGGGKNSKEISDMMKDMEKTEQDLVNKMISNETLKRQQDILTRLLESEKAEKERELDEKRASDEAKNYDYSNPGEFFKYKKQKQDGKELLKTVPPALNSFYKQKVNEYFYNFVE